MAFLTEAICRFPWISSTMKRQKQFVWILVKLNEGGDFGLGRTVEADVAGKDEEYSGSPAPLALFLVLFLVFTILAFPHPGARPDEYALSFLSGIVAFVSLAFLPATVVINKEWEEAIVLRFGKFQRLGGPGFFFK